MVIAGHVSKEMLMHDSTDEGQAGSRTMLETVQPTPPTRSPEVDPRIVGRRQCLNRPDGDVSPSGALQLQNLLLLVIHWPPPNRRADRDQAREEVFQNLILLIYES